MCSVHHAKSASTYTVCVPIDTICRWRYLSVSVRSAECQNTRRIDEQVETNPFFSNAVFAIAALAMAILERTATDFPVLMKITFNFPSCTLKTTEKKSIASLFVLSLWGKYFSLKSIWVANRQNINSDNKNGRERKTNDLSIKVSFTIVFVCAMELYNGKSMRPCTLLTFASVSVSTSSPVRLMCAPNWWLCCNNRHVTKR